VIKIRAREMQLTGSAPLSCNCHRLLAIPHRDGPVRLITGCGEIGALIAGCKFASERGRRNRKLHG
jgi:hypothetical protein